MLVIWRLLDKKQKRQLVPLNVNKFPLNDKQTVWYLWAQNKIVKSKLFFYLYKVLGNKLSSNFL